tara:strand:+ start:2631 stop:2816 length:186 start_codon:yes stop_codon:yes gene_type:complete
MTLIIELAFLVGFTMSIDATQMYGIDSIKDCNRMLPTVILAYKADNGICLTGDINEKPSEA